MRQPGKSRGLRPQATADVREAQRLLRREGACLVRWNSCEREDTVAAGSAVLQDERIRVRWTPFTLRPHPAPDKGLRVERATRTIFEPSERAGHEVFCKELRIHSEGPSYGQARPDYAAMLYAQAADEGGESYLVDAVQLVCELSQNPANADLLEFLWDPTEAGGDPDGPPPGGVARRTRRGRVAVALGTLPPSATAAGAAPSRRTAMLQRWHALVRERAADAPRFDIAPGEVLVLDTYRMMHGRERYRGEQLTFLAYFWSDEAFAFPMVTELEHARAKEVVGGYA